MLVYQRVSPKFDDGRISRNPPSPRLRSHCFLLQDVLSNAGGCSALLALLLGNRLVVAGVGDCRVLLLEGEGKACLMGDLWDFLGLSGLIKD